MTESYHGTRGHSGGEASKDAAVAERDSGKTNEMMDRVLMLINMSYSRGVTSAELRAQMPDEHHGRITSALTKLHIAGTIVALRERRENCGIYVRPDWVVGRDTRPYRRQNVRLQLDDVQAVLDVHLWYDWMHQKCNCGKAVLGRPGHETHLAETIVALSRGEL